MDVAEKTEAVRAEKTSDQLEILDVKKYPSLYGRLFIESVIPGADMMDPDLAPLNLRFLATPHDIDNRSYDHIFENLSIEERREQWKGIQYGEAYSQWQTKFTDFMKRIKDPKRIEALKVILPGKEPSTFGAEDADTLFKDFSRDKTDVTSFAKRVVANLVQNGKVDAVSLQALLPHIEWIASGIFGEKTSGIVNRVIEIEAQLQNNAKEFGIYLHNASPGKPELGSEERSILATLHTFRKKEKKQDQQQPDQQPPAQPEHAKKEDQAVPEEMPGLDAARLKAIYERCVAKYEGQNPNGLLDINVVLDEADRAQVRKLIDIAKSTHTKLTDGNPDWATFVKLREEMRAIHGTFMENTRFIEDNSVQTPTPETKDNIPIIKVPTNIFILNLWDSRIRLLEFAFDKYDKGNSRGVMAEYLGNDIKDVHEFVKASQSFDKKDIPPETKQESQEKVSDEKPPAPPAKETEDADKKPDTSQEKQETTIKVVMTENDKGEAQFKLTANGKEIPLKENTNWFNSIDTNEYVYLEVPSGITATFLVELPDVDWDSIKILGGQGAKLNLKTLKALEVFSIGFNSAKLEFPNEDLSRREGQIFRRGHSLKKRDVSGEWITQEDLDVYLTGVETLNEARKILNETEPSQSSSEAGENVITLEGRGDLIEELNNRLRQNLTSAVTFGVSPDILKPYIASMAEGVVKEGTVEINKKSNQIGIKGIEIKIPKIGGTATFDLLIDNGPDGITANIQNYGGGLRARGARGEVEKRIRDINSVIKKRLDEEISTDTSGWKTKKVSILDGRVLIEFERATQTTENLDSSVSTAEQVQDPRDKLPLRKILDDAIADPIISKRLSEIDYDSKTYLDEITETWAAAEKDPHDIRSWTWLGTLSRDKIKDPYLTDRIFQETIRNNPQDIPTRNYYVIALDSFGQVDKAVEAAEKAIQEGLINGESLNRFAEIFRQNRQPVGKMDTINRAFEKLLSEAEDKKEDQSYIDTATWYAYTLHRFEGNTDRAIEIFNESIRKYKQNSRAWIDYVYFLDRYDKKDEIPDILKKAIAESVTVDDEFIACFRYHYNPEKRLSETEATEEIKRLQTQ